MRQPYEWPSRERWAEHYVHPPWDEGDRCPYNDRYSQALSDYATPEEIAALTTALKDHYRKLGSELKAVNLCIDPAHQQQRGEGQVVWYRRYKELPEAERKPLAVAGLLRNERSRVNDLLARIRNDEIPNRTRDANYVPGKPGELVAPISARYQAAFEAARDAYFREYADQHVPDDAAWERELERRARIEAVRAHNAVL
jgi:hypothetical protein